MIGECTCIDIHETTVRRMTLGCAAEIADFSLSEFWSLELTYQNIIELKEVGTNPIIYYSKRLLQFETLMLGLLVAMIELSPNGLYIDWWKIK